MPNIEIKARCSDINRARDICRSQHTQHEGLLHQVDTYYTTKHGRLKLREINGEQAQLIPYLKDYQTGPMRSQFSVIPVTELSIVKPLLEQLLGVIGVIDKQREVFLLDNVRVHLDHVVNLGSFIEFEAVYDSDDALTRQQETAKVRALMQTFSIREADLLDRSYIDYWLMEYTNVTSSST